MAISTPGMPEMRRGSSRRWSASARRRCSDSCACSIASAARSAACWSSSRSSSVNTRGVSEPTCSTPSDAPLDQQRDAEQRADALLAQDRVVDVGVVDVLDRDRAALGGDPAGEALADGDRDALLDLLLDALRGARPQHLRGLVEHEDRRRVGVQDLGDAVQQLGEQLVLGQVGEGGVGDPLQGLEMPCRGLGRGARRALAPVQLRVLDRQRGAVGGVLEQLAVLVGERARGERAHVQHAERAPLDEQRDAEQRADALLAQDRVHDVGVVDVLDRDGPALGHDAAGEALADGDRDALLDLLLDALRGACPQHLRAPRRAAGSRPCRRAGSR